jgi:hypothetical protein
MTGPIEPVDDSQLEEAIEHLLQAKADRAANGANPFELVLAQGIDRRSRRRRRILAIAGSGVLVVGLVLVGIELTSLLRSQPSVASAPSPTPSATGIEALRRPLEMPVLAADGSCPVTPVGLTLESLGAFQGSGPVRVNDLNDIAVNELPLHDGWYGQKVFWAVDARESGPILVRVARIDGTGGIGLGTDNGPELVLSNSFGSDPVVGPAPSFPIERIFIDGVSFREPGCYFMQMDGPATTSTIVFRARGPVSPSPAPSLDYEALHRPLQLPTLPVGAPCPITPTTTPAGLTSLPGGGPIYPMTTTVGGVVFFDPASPPNGPGALVTWMAAPGFQGPVLIRGRSLRGGGALTFGPAEQSQLLIPATDIPTPIGPPGWVALESDLTVIPEAGGCYGYQLDGPTFSTIITFAAQPAAGLADALGRPLHLPSLVAGAACPATAPRPIVNWSGPGIGPGPVYSIGYDPAGNISWAGSQEDGGWFYVKILWLAAPGTGPILIRGGQLDGANTLGFGSDPIPSPQLVLEQSDAVGVSGASPGWLNYVAYTRVRASGCYAYQIDTGSGSETIPFEAGP